MTNDIINNSYVVGIAGRNLVLNTLGRVYVKRQDRYYELKIGEQEIKRDGSEIPDIVVVNTEEDILNLPYPGDGKIIIGADGSLYITIDGSLVKWEPECNCGGEVPTLDGDVTINGVLTVNHPDGTPLVINNNPNFPPFIINGNILVAGLNAEYLNGLSSDRFAIKSADEYISGLWQFGDVNVSGILGDGYTTLDMITSTLTVDNLIVRNSIQAPDDGGGGDEEAMTYHIFGTNEETWVGKELFCNDMYLITSSEVPASSTTVDEFTGDYYIALIKGDDEFDVSLYVSKDSVIKSELFFYKVVDLSVDTLYLRSLPNSGQEAETKFVVIGHTSDNNKKGSIVMNSIEERSPYFDVVSYYNSTPAVRLGNLNGLSPDPTFDNISGYGAFFNGNTYIKNPNIAFGNNRFNADGSGRIGQYTWSSNGTGIASSTSLGVVKIGDGLSISSDGTVSAESGEAVPIATYSRPGIVQVGKGLNVNAGGTISVNTMGDWQRSTISTAAYTLYYADCGNKLQVAAKITTASSVLDVSASTAILNRFSAAADTSTFWFGGTDVFQPAVVHNASESNGILIAIRSAVVASGRLTVTLRATAAANDVVYFWLPLQLP